jgi:hypothetical protein
LLQVTGFRRIYFDGGGAGECPTIVALRHAVHVRFDATLQRVEGVCADRLQNPTTPATQSCCCSFLMTRNQDKLKIEIKIKFDFDFLFSKNKNVFKIFPKIG